MSIPEGYICPISHQIMLDPYIDTDGNSYERASIMEWLLTRQVSPITRRPLRVENLVPNRALKTLIDEFRAAFPSDSDLPLPPPPSAEPIPLDRKPIMLFAVIDNSGSMGEPCGASANEDKEDDGFSRLDLVKHTMNTIITSLTKYDQICLIKFSTNAEVIAHVTKLTDANKAILMQTMNSLTPEYSTNIWDGLRTALDIVTVLPAEDVSLYNVEVFLLTDGVPNINPPRPITETLESYLNKKCTVLRPKVHTFGYGYRLQSDVLYELAKVGNGTFGFIPDSSMVGTVFINSLSNSLVGADVSTKDATIDAVSEQFCALLRTLVCTFVYADRLAQLSAFIATTEATLASHDAPRVVAFLQAVMLDCKETDDANAGQIHKAIQEAFFSKWGKHYLYSVLSAFEHQVCINFKDKAMQSFKSDKFKVEQERIEEVFMQLPAPTPSIRQQSPYNQGGRRSASSSSSAPSRAAPVSMNNYHHAGGGCFSADSVVLSVLQDKVVPVQVGEVRAGTVVMSHLGPTEVECVVRLRYQGPLFQVESLKLTPYHPIMRSNEGVPQFPIDCADAPASEHDGYVYDFVLRNRGVIASPTQQGAETCLFAATFGHTVTRGCFAHAYFGSERVVTELKAHPTWTTGSILLERYSFLRAGEEEGRVVVGIVYDTDLRVNGELESNDVSLVVA